MKKINYEFPAIEVLKVDLQQGFAQSNLGSSLGDFTDVGNIYFDE